MPWAVSLRARRGLPFFSLWWFKHAGVSAGPASTDCNETVLAAVTSVYAEKVEVDRRLGFVCCSHGPERSPTDGWSSERSRLWVN